MTWQNLFVDLVLALAVSMNAGWVYERPNRSSVAFAAFIFAVFLLRCADIAAGRGQ